MTLHQFIHTFWQSLGERTTIEQTTINQALKEMYYNLGLKQVKALESIDQYITQNRVYTVQLIKEEHFPDGEECVQGDNGEWVTLLCFERALMTTTITHQ